MKQTKHLVYISLLTSMALVLHLVERNIPVPFMTPGAKLGLANLITVLALYTLKRKREVVEIIIVRLILGSLLGGSVSALLYGSMGALFSLIVMIGIKEGLKEEVSPIGVSAAGAVFHNIGQLTVASLIVQNSGVMMYLPFLAAAGLVTGIFIGITADYIIKHMRRLSFFEHQF